MPSKDMDSAAVSSTTALEESPHSIDALEYLFTKPAQSVIKIPPRAIAAENIWQKLAIKNHQAPRYKPSLTSLAPELHLMFISFLAPIDKACLRMTCRYFKEIISKMKAREVAKLPSQINGRHPYPKVLFCNYCDRARPLKHFADKMYEVNEYKARNKKGKFHVKANKMIVPGVAGTVGSDFYCVDCAIKLEREGYRSGDIMVIGDQYHVVCSWCKQSGKLASTERPGICETCADAAYNRIIKRDLTTRVLTGVKKGLSELVQKMSSTAIHVCFSSHSMST